VVDEVDHGGQRGALAAASGAGDEGEPALRERDVHDRGREVELFDVGDDGADGPHCHAGLAGGVVGGAAEAAGLGVGVGEVDPAGGVGGGGVVAEVLGEHAADLGGEVGGGDRRRLEADQVAVDADDGAAVALEVDVGGAGGDGLAEQGVEVGL